MSILERAAELGVTLHHVTQSPRSLPVGLTLPRPSALAALETAKLAGVDFSGFDADQVLVDASLPGRWHWLENHVLLDVAHNPDAAAHLLQRLDSDCAGRPVHAVVGIYSDKDIHGVLGSLVERIDRWYVSSVPEDRAASPELILAVLRELGAGEKASTYAKVTDAYDAALAARTGAEIVLVFGSFPVVAAVLATRTRS